MSAAEAPLAAAATAVAAATTVTVAFFGFLWPRPGPGGRPWRDDREACPVYQTVLSARLTSVIPSPIGSPDR